MPGVAEASPPLIALASVLRSSGSGVIKQAEAFARDGNLYIVVDVAEKDINRVEIRIENGVIWVKEAGDVDDFPETAAGFTVPQGAELARATMEYYDTALVLRIPLARDFDPADLIESQNRFPETNFDVTEELLQSLHLADSPHQIVELLQLTEADLRHLLEKEKLDPEERAAAEVLTHAALIRQLMARRRPRAAVAEVY